MIDFKSDGADLQRACFGGSIDDICAELRMEVAIVYGAIASRDKDAANEFRAKVMFSFIDPDIGKRVFSSEVYDAIKDSSSFAEISVDSKELAKQLQELLKNEGQ